MNPIIKNILAVIAGFVVGSVVNMALLKINGTLIPLPEGADVSSMEGLKASMHLFEPIHFVPLFSSALGTFVGAYLAAFIAASHKMKFAYVIGILFLLGGIANSLMLPSPVWFTFLDIIVAYIPMAYIGGKLALKPN